MALNIGSDMFPRKTADALTDRDAIAGDWTKIVEEGTLIIARRSTGTGTLYTVPAGKVFYIMAYTIYCELTGSSRLNIRTPAAAAVYSARVNASSATSGESLAQSFPTPLKITAGFYIENEVTGTGEMSFFGYELDE